MPTTPSLDGLTLAYQIDRTPRPCAAALLIHGYGEHCRRYDDFVCSLNNAGISVLRFDLRGHGRSEGLAGHIESFDDYIADVGAMVMLFERELMTEECPLNRLLLAHSNGGLIATHALATMPSLNRWDAAVFSAPFFGLKLHVPFWKRAFAHGLSRLIPRFRLPTGSNAHLLARSCWLELE